jgi:hypothetical protein
MIIHKPNPWDGVFKFVARTEDELRAYLDAEIASARCGPAPVGFEPGDDDDEPVEPAPQPAPRRPKPPSLTKALREAKKAGIPVTGATFTADSVSLSFGEAAKSNGNDLDQWLAGRHENPTQRN